MKRTRRAGGGKITKFYVLSELISSSMLCKISKNKPPSPFKRKDMREGLLFDLDKEFSNLCTGLV